MIHPISRRDVLRVGAAGVVCGMHGASLPGDEPKRTDALADRPFLTPSRSFRDVSRGNPIPHTLTGESLVRARLTPETWRLEIVADDKVEMQSPRTTDAGTAIDYPSLLRLGGKHGVRFLKALQCNNIALPLGQGLWEGVPLRDLLKLCGKIGNARRLYYWGFHNDDPKQMFRSSLAINQVLDAPPGELPPFVAYKLNGEAIPLSRGGPVRMVVPWAHGFKSIKWLQRIVLTNRYDANDTYAEQNNDPESYLKTAAYFESLDEAKFAAGGIIVIRGTAMVGWPGLERVEYWLRPNAGGDGKLSDDDPAWRNALWQPGEIDPPPADWTGALPDGTLAKDVWGFTADGKPKEWPLRYSIAHWTVALKGIKSGRYELRVRTLDKNGFAQPEPRPYPRSGQNAVRCKLITVV